MDTTIVERVRTLAIDDPEAPPGEILRRLQAEGSTVGLSTLYWVLRAARATIPAPLLVRLEGMAGEFAQFDFGQVSVRLAEGRRRVVHFAAYRLKYSRCAWWSCPPNASSPSSGVWAEKRSGSLFFIRGVPAVGTAH